MGEDASGWQNFYLMAGGAAAALTGLIFLALSLHAKAIMANPFFRDRAFTSILSLMTQVFLSAAVLVPGQPPLAIGLEVELVPAYFLIRTVRAVRLRRAVGAHGPPRPRSWVLAEYTGWSLWLLVLVTSGVELMIGAPGGFYLLALAMVYMFMFGSNV